VNRLAYDAFEAKRGANAVYFRLLVNAVMTGVAIGLRKAASGTDGRLDPGERLRTGRTERSAFSAAADAVLREQEIQCRSLELR
jgi:hypothetical protein